MATTFAIVAVFVPIAFMSGIIGRFFFQFGVTVAVAVLVSLFVSFTLDPMLSSVWHDPPGSRFRRVPVARPLHGPRRARHRVAASRLRRRFSSGRSRIARACSRIALGHVLRELRDRAAGRHRVRTRDRPELHVAAAQHAGRLEPRVHRQQGAAGRGGAEGHSRDRAGDDHDRHRRGTQLRARQPQARRSRASARARRRRSSSAIRQR